jgi:hypothetical protein
LTKAWSALLGSSAGLVSGGHNCSQDEKKLQL